MDDRVAVINRTTSETTVKLSLNLDGDGKQEINSGVPFLDHMLSLWTKHGFFNLALTANGDVEIDDHHTVEDIGICLGKALQQALGKKTGISRYGTSFVPMDEALVMVSLDLSGRAYLAMEMDLPSARVGNFDTELVEEFFRAVAYNAGITLHVRMLAGRNTHHIVEGMFKAFGRALREAVNIDPQIKGVMSTKGQL